MKILIISPKFHPIIGGGETFVLNSINRLHSAGINISIAVEPLAERNVDNYPYGVYEINGLSDSKLDIIAATAGLHKLIERLNPDIIHVHGYFGLLVVGLCNHRNIPVIASIHSTPVWGERIIGGMDSFEAELSFARGVIDLARPKLLTAANQVYAEAANKIVRGKLPVEAVPYPVDITLFTAKENPQLRQEFGLSDNDILIMTPSRVIPRKGIKEIVRALVHLPSNYYLCLPAAVEPLDTVFWESLKSQASYPSIKNRIIIPSRKFLYEDMPKLYAASDIIAMPSYYEGAPVATVEAMASGKPFIGADSQGINSFIRNNQNGLLVPQQSVAKLAEAILFLSKNIELQKRLADQAVKDIGYLSWEVQLPTLIKLYESVIGKQEPATSLLGNRLMQKAG